MASPVQNPPSLVVRQHIQDHAAATSVEPHWGYAERVVPCVVDAGSCEYLDVVYGAHDQGMVFVAIMWAVLLAVFFGFGIGRRLIPSRRSSVSSSVKSSDVEATANTAQLTSYRLASSMSASIRRYLLPDTFLRSVFGRVTSLQILILTILSIYLTIFTFVGYKYATWVTPVKNSPGVYNTRTSLGPFSDRIGVLAYALLPLSVLLATRESLLSLLTGIPYQSFQPMHRWLGYIIYIQSAVHTIGWTVVEAKLYQPQPKVWTNFIKQLYMIWGVVAMVLLTLIVALSFSCSVRRTGGYEIFRKLHYVMAMVFLGACYGHWAQLGCFLIASLVVWFLDRAARLIRTLLLHYQYLPEGSGMGFQAARAKISYFPDETNGDVVRLDFTHNHAAWEVGQHFYLCFPESSIWQSHPFTPLSLPGLGKEGQQHSYVFRAKGGETRKLAELAQRKILEISSSKSAEESKSTSILPGALQGSKREDRQLAPTISVVLQGPYGRGHVEKITRDPDVNVLLVAGGSGITFVIPTLFHLMTIPVLAGSAGRDRKIELVWAIRRRSDMKWVERELDTLSAASKRMNLTIRIFVTREDEVESAKFIDEDKKGTTTTTTTVQEQAKNGSSSTSTQSDDIDEKDDKIQPPTNQEVSEVQIHSDSESSSTPQRRFSVHQASHADVLRPETRHPDLAKIVNDFVAATVRGPTSVYASGPGGLISDLREVVASCNDGGKVWRGDERWSVELVNDDRIEW